jgi:hypothetical protein
MFQRPRYTLYIMFFHMFQNFLVMSWIVTVINTAHNKEVTMTMMMTTTTMMWWWSRVLRIQFGTSGFKCEPPEFSHFIHLFLIWSSLIANDLSLILLLWVKHSIPINIQLVMLTTSQDYISILTLSLPWVHLIRLFFCIWVLIGSQPTRAEPLLHLYNSSI